MEIVVKKSKIHGKGVFANRDFKKGEVVLKHNFKSLTKKEYDKLSNADEHFVGHVGGTRITRHGSDGMRPRQRT